MFKNMYPGNDQYSDYVREKNKEIERDVIRKMEKLSEINSKCDSMLKILNRISEDVNKLEREVNVLHRESKEKLVQICDVIENIDNKINDR